MIRLITRIRISALSTLVTGGLMGSPIAAQEVEIISGLAAPTARVGAAPGIRVIAFVQFEPASTSYRVVEPVLATEILSVQEALARLGHEPGARDGILGPGTAAALTVFQADRGLRTCGCVDYSTAVALGLEERVVQTVLGSPEDEPAAEILMPEGRLAPARVTEMPPPPADTVTVVREGPPLGWAYGPADVLVPGIPLPQAADGADAVSVGRGWVPFGSTATRGRATIRTIRPPRR